MAIKGDVGRHGEAGAVFVLGAPRSGTSLLYTALCLDERAAWTSNWLFRLPWATPVATLNRIASHLPRRRGPAWFGADGANAYVYANRRSVLDRLFPRPVEAENLFERCGVGEAGPAEGSEHQAAQALRSHFRALRRWTGRPVVVNKRIANNLRIPFLASAFPDARFVVLTRDGRAVAQSLSRVAWWPDSSIWWYGGTPREWETDGGDPWALCARHWVEELAAIDVGLQALDPGRVLHLRYEDLLAEPVAALVTAAEFSGLEGGPSWRRALAGVRFPNRNDAWRELPTEVIDTVESVQADALIRHGYATVTR